VKTSPPVPRLASIDRSQLLLRPVDVERLIDADHSARSIWQLIGRLDLSLYHAEIVAVEGSAGRDVNAYFPKSRIFGKLLDLGASA